MRGFRVVGILNLGFCVLCLAACGDWPDGLYSDAALSQSLPIINGEDCDADTMETAVAILVDVELDSFLGTQQVKTVMCTGTLIAPDTVLTAAHCLDASLLDPFGGLLGSSVGEPTFYVSRQPDLSAWADQASPATTMPADAIEVADYYAHPDFDVHVLNTTVDGPGDFKDIGLIFLAETIDDVEPEVLISLAEAEQIVEQAVVEIAGWGLQVEWVWSLEDIFGDGGGPPAGSLGIKQCATSFINELGFAEMQIGAGQDTSRKCQGDSGGPTYMDVDTEHLRKRRLIGVTSHAYDEELCAKGGVDTRVDYWLEWIDARMSERCEAGTRIWCAVPGIIPASYWDPEPGTGPGSQPVTDPDQLRRPSEDEKSGCNAVGAPAWPVFLAMLLGLWRERSSREL